MKNTNSQLGFTLIELMMVVTIVALLAAIAYPSYQQYTIKNAESQAKAQLGELEIELDRWRATALTYKGFKPTKGSDEFGYADNTNTFVYVPRNATESNYRYKIEIFDGNFGTSLVSDKDKLYDGDIAIGQSWVMVATPNTDKIKDSRIKKFIVRNTGLKCAVSMTNAGTLTKETKVCETGMESW